MTTEQHVAALTMPFYPSDEDRRALAIKTLSKTPAVKPR